MDLSGEVTLSINFLIIFVNLVFVCISFAGEFSYFVNFSGEFSFNINFLDYSGKLRFSVHL